MYLRARANNDKEKKKKEKGNDQEKNLPYIISFDISKVRIIRLFVRPLNDCPNRIVETVVDRRYLLVIFFLFVPLVFLYDESYSFGSDGALVRRNGIKKRKSK